MPRANTLNLDGTRALLLTPQTFAAAAACLTRIRMTDLSDILTRYSPFSAAPLPSLAQRERERERELARPRTIATAVHSLLPDPPSMALRTLMARVRTSAAALRLQTPALGLSPLPGGRPHFHSAAATRLSPPAGGRPCLISSRNLRTRINLESASKEELEREATFLSEQINEFVDRILKEKERSDLIMKDIWGTLKRMACCAAVVKVITFVISPNELAEEDEVMD